MKERERKLLISGVRGLSTTYNRDAGRSASKATMVIEVFRIDHLLLAKGQRMSRVGHVSQGTLGSGIWNQRSLAHKKRKTTGTPQNAHSQ